jgi:thiosulfate dehydrogenase (quinone) large subunit
MGVPILNLSTLPTSMSEEKIVAVAPALPRIQWNMVFANLLLRAWIFIRLVGAGLDKFRAGDAETTTFSLDNYDAKMKLISKTTYEHGFLPKALCDAYAKPLGYILLAAGAWVLLGLFMDLSLLFAGFVVLSLGVGLATLPDDTEVVYIGIHVLIIAAALVTARHKSLSVDGLFFRRRVD